MALFIRKNIVTFSIKFTAADGSGQQPGAVNASIKYKDLAGSSHEDVFPLSYTSLTGTWVGTWDTSKSGQGTVYWMIYGFGNLQASSQGEFVVEANPANNL